MKFLLLLSTKDKDRQCQFKVILLRNIQITQEIKGFTVGNIAILCLDIILVWFHILFVLHLIYFTSHLLHITVLYILYYILYLIYFTSYYDPYLTEFHILSVTHLTTSFIYSMTYIFHISRLKSFLTFYISFQLQAIFRN